MSWFQSIGQGECMELQTLNNSICDFYREIGLLNDFQKISYFQNSGTVALNAATFDDPVIYENIKEMINNLQAFKIDALLEYRMHVYHQKAMEVIPVLRRLNMNFDLIEQIGNITILQQAMLNLIDLAIYNLAIADKSHEVLNTLRETIFTLEDYCLQIEHTIHLREQHQVEGMTDELQLKLIEDEKQMHTYYEQIKKIIDLVIKHMKNSTDKVD